MSMIEESNEIKRLLNNLVDKEIDEKSKECLRLYKAVVTSVATQIANKWYIGVKIAPHTTAADNSITILSTYMCKNCAVGDYVWVAKMYNSMNNAFAMYPMDFIFGTDYSGGGGNYLPLSAGSSYPLTGTLYTQAILPNIAGYQIGSATQYFGDIYAVDYKLKNKTNAYSDTPTNPSTNYIDFLDKNNVEFARIYVQIGQGYNGLNFILKNKSNADNRLAFFYDSSGWYFRSSNDKATNLGANTLRWNNIWGRQLNARDTESKIFAYIEGDSYTTTPTSDKAARFLAVDDNGNWLGGMNFYHFTSDYYQVRLYARHHNTNYSSFVTFETTKNATSNGQAGYSSFFPGYNGTIDLGKSSYGWRNIYLSGAINIKDTINAYSDTPATAAYKYMYFTDKNNTGYAYLSSAIGSSWNALNFSLRNKSNVAQTIEIVHNGSQWNFDSVTDKGFNLGTSTRRWNEIWGRRLRAKDTTPNIDAVLENDDYTTAPSSNQFTQILARDKSDNYLGGVRIYHLTNGNIQVQLMGRHQNTNNQTQVLLETLTGATSSNQAGYSIFRPEGNNATDLGTSGKRWRRLHLGSNLYLYNKTITDGTYTWTFPNSTGTVALKEELGGLSNPNFIINSNFKINQRGAASYNTRQKFTVDRWFISSSTTNPFTVTPLSAVDGGINITGSSISYASYLNQYIEIDSSYFSGKTLTLSCYVESITGSLELSFASNSMVLTTGLNKLTFTATGTAGEFKAITFIRSKNTSCNANIKWVKLEETSFYTTYIPPDPILELVKCQRYYTSYKTALYPSYSVSTNTARFTIFTPTEMRTSPTATFSSGHGYILGNGNSVSVSSITLHTKQGNAITYTASTSSNIINQNSYTYTTGTNVVMELDAEIYSYNG